MKQRPTLAAYSSTASSVALTKCSLTDGIALSTCCTTSRKALVEEVLRRRVAQRVRTPALADNPEAAADNVPDRAPGHRSNRGIERQEQRSVRARGTNSADVAKDCLAE